MADMDNPSHPQQFGLDTWVGESPLTPPMDEEDEHSQDVHAETSNSGFAASISSLRSLLERHASAETEASTSKANNFTENSHLAPRAEQVYQSIDSYDWDNDQAFQEALAKLSATFEPSDLEARARCYLWARYHAIEIDWKSYKDWQKNATSNAEKEELYRSIDSYDWKDDKVFQRGLAKLLETSDLKPSDLEPQARCAYWARKHQVKINWKSYRNWQTWKTAESTKKADVEHEDDRDFDKILESILTENSSATTGPTLYSQFQERLLLTGPSAATTTAPVTSSEPLPVSEATPPPYPQSFQALVDMITSGRSDELPIKQIPPTILADKKTAPVVGIRRKPWETNDGPSMAGSGMFGDRRDVFIRQELPEV